jgi:hypothetical protein
MFVVGLINAAAVCLRDHNGFAEGECSCGFALLRFSVHFKNPLAKAALFDHALRAPSAPRALACTFVVHQIVSIVHYRLQINARTSFATSERSRATSFI